MKADADPEQRHRREHLPRLVAPLGEHRGRRGEGEHPDRERPLHADPAAEPELVERRKQLAGSVGLTVDSADLYEAPIVDLESGRV